MQSANLQLLRHISFRRWIVVALIALLCCGLFFTGGAFPALLPAIFIFSAWLVTVVVPGFSPKLASLSDPAKERTPARAPPLFSF
ncbi:MAG TPA: hypothetical protein VGG97_24700 [Bryobacteraceae bacterium]|jgi:hypothetical protein